MKLVPRQPPARLTRLDANVGRGMEFALSTLVFLGVGYLLDRWLGTRPVFMILFVVLGLVGNFARIWFDYGRKMAQHEADRVAAMTSRDR